MRYAELSDAGDAGGEGGKCHGTSPVRAVAVASDDHIICARLDQMLVSRQEAAVPWAVAGLRQYLDEKSLRPGPTACRTAKQPGFARPAGQLRTGRASARDVRPNAPSGRP